MAGAQKNKQEDRFLKKAAQGNREGLEYLVNTYKNLAYTVAITILRNREDAEEVVQDAFIKAFASLKGFKKSSKFSTWLYRIVYNCALTKIASRKIMNASLEEVSSHEKNSNAENKGWDALRSHEKRKYIDRAMDRLSPEDRLLFTLHYVHGKTISEIGNIMDLKRSAIKMRLLRGRKQLKIELESVLGNEVKNLL
ncbi:RNA polymerase sigma factor [Ulvibacterium marinum]|uniref:RNA polymerase sigma factor n=1 Tax=Ulvibacterium marinum TaxID=2419782 RepID=UPI0024940A57|nr:RNA polymerase sigma factor [Ulvibacterium marinum]